jgi:ATP-dependent Clp endopeptidase proteolytic subunit ClpP
MRDRRDWYRIANLADAPGPVRVDIYDEIGAGDPWSGGGVSASEFVADLAGVKGDLEVHINSPGGSVFDGLAIYNAIAQRPGNVTTVVDGLAASAASFIAQAGKTRIVAPGAMVMIHDAHGLCIGNEADMTETAALLAKASSNLAGIYAAHSGRPAFEWRQAMQAETWYTAQEAVDAGLADRVAERPAAAETVTTAAAWARELRAEARRVLEAGGGHAEAEQQAEPQAAVPDEPDDLAAPPAWLTALTVKEAAAK